MQMKKHPKLARKLKLLYQLKARPEITNNQQLANVLGLSRQSVSKWGTGSRTRSGDAIPDAHFFRIGRLFGIDSYLFTLEFEEFEKEIRMTLDRRNRRRLRRPRQVLSNNLPVTSGKQFGRESELDTLSEAWNYCAANVVQLTGISGIGKSALVNEWLSRMNSENYRGAESVFAWSFDGNQDKSSGFTSSAAFFDCALTLLGDASATRDDPENQVIRLLQLIRKERTLLVLDGVQNLQYAYGPSFGQFRDSALALLLRELAKTNSGLCILTSRLKNADLESIGAPRAVAMELQGLDDAAAKNLLLCYEVHGEPHQFAHALRQHEGLPRSLRLLGKHLDMVSDGNLANYMELAPLLEECGESERAAHQAQDYLARLPLEGQRKFFYLLSLYKRSASLREILGTCRYRRIQGLSREILSLTQMELRYGIFAMEKAGIVRVQRRRQGMILELAPFAGEAIALDLKRELPALWVAGNRMLFDRMREKKMRSRLSARDRDMLYRTVICGVRGESWDDAFELYFRRIRKGQFFLSNSGCRYLDQACLREFFSDPWSRVNPGVSSEESKYDLQFCAAVNLANFGDIDQATELSRSCLKWYLNRKHWAQAVSAAGLLLAMLLVAGRLPDATRWAKRFRRRLARDCDPLVAVSGDMLSASVLFLRGKVEKASKLLRRADKVLAAAEPGAEVNIPLANYYFSRYLLETGAMRNVPEKSHVDFSARESGCWQISGDTALSGNRDFSILGMILQQQGDRVNAKRSLDQQVEILRYAGEWLCLAASLNCRARFLMETGDYRAAKADLDEALGIARRMGAVAIEWESLLNLAGLCSRKSHIRLGRQYLKSAQEMAGMEDYRFREQEIRELERALVA